MPAFNSIRSTHYLLYLIILFTTGCAEKATTHSFIKEIPPAIDVAQSVKKIDKNEDVILTSPSKKIPNTSHTPVYATVWDRLFSLYALPEIDNERIEYEMREYLKYPEYLAKIQRRAAPYLYFIVNEIEFKQIPGELALLPVVESAFKTHALSKSQASGLWQFIPATGRLFGLKQNWWYDGRRDVYTSTQAAISYLKQLNHSFRGDWFLALASYNAGKGNIGKAIRKNQNQGLLTDYWSLPLRQETMTYVPRLLAIAKIFANADKYNIPLLDIPDVPHFKVINVGSQIDLTFAAEIAKTSISDFTALNPAFKRESTDPDGPFHLLIHADKVNEFADRLSRTIKKDRMKWIHHNIKPGETLKSIAKKYGTTVNVLTKSNHIENKSIQAGNILLIPSTFVNKPSEQHALTTKQKHLYTVKKGDTVWNIARQFDVRSKDIASWNNISLNKALTPGQKLIIKES